jgi:hypothetical protein
LRYDSLRAEHPSTTEAPEARSYQSGTLPAELGDPRTRYYIAGFCGAAGRIARRFWYANTLGHLCETVGDHFAGTLIEQQWKDEQPYPSLSRSKVTKRKMGRKTTNPIESTFATVRLRTHRTKGSGSRIATLTMVFKLGLEAQKHWRRLQGFELIPKVATGVRFVDGEQQTQQAA